MGYKRAIRSLVAISNRSSRESQSYQRQLERERKLALKEQEYAENLRLVNVYNEYIDRIQNLHKICESSSYDWKNIKKQSPPVKPTRSKDNEQKAQNELNVFKPSFFDKLFKKDKKKIQKLKDDLANAKKTDTQNYNNLLAKYKEELESHNELVELATKVLDKDLEAYQVAINELSPLAELNDIGATVEYSKIEKDKIVVSILNDNDMIIPKTQFILLKSGKLSEKNLPISKRNEIYQDYVCSSALRIGRELFTLLPIKEVVVNVKSNLLNTSTGRKEYQTILSVKLVRETMDYLNFDRIDPSDSMDNFIHNMDYKKTKGMFPVEDIE